MLRTINVTPDRADEMELWQIAVLLGADVDRADPFPEDLWQREKDTLAGRAERIRQMKTPPPADQVDITERVMRQMGIRTE